MLMLYLTAIKKQKGGRVKENDDYLHPLFKIPLMKYLSFVLITIILLAGSCLRKECRDIPGGYQFVIPVELSPALDTFQVGDTISIRSSFSNQVYEVNTARTYELDNFKFDPNIAAVKIDTVNADEGAIRLFTVAESNVELEFREYSTGASVYIGEYAYNNEIYNLELQIVPEQEGLFVLFINSLILDGRQPFPGKCSGLDGYRPVMRINDNVTDNNIDLLSESPDPHYNDWILQRPQERFFDAGGYCFYVVE